MKRSQLANVLTGRLSLFIGLLALTILGLAVSALIRENHVLRNLEPYPDGLWYALAAKNFASEGSMALIYADTYLRLNTPPAYSWMLAMGYLFWSDPTSFVLVNALLSIASMGLIVSTVYSMTKKEIPAMVVGLLFLLHAYYLWLITLPMAENALLFFFCLFLWGLFQPVVQKKSDLASLIGIAGLFLTKFSVIGLCCVGLLLVVLKRRELFRRVSKEKKILGGGLVLVLLALIASKPYLSSYQSAFNNLVSGDNRYFNLGFVLPNLWFYLKGLFSPSYFLWQQLSLSNIWLLFFLAVASIKARNDRKVAKQFFILLILFASVLSTPLFFYQPDLRYIVISGPLLLLGVGIGLSLWAKQKVVLLILSALLCLTTVWTQAPLLKQVVSSSILGRSTAWQLEAIEHLDRIIAGENSYVITALPPHLVSAYQSGSYQLLPLSISQEFISKKQFVWGKSVDYENLDEYFQELAENGNRVFLTNAYISHSADVQEDYRVLLESMPFSLVSEGCYNTCDIYELNAP